MRSMTIIALLALAACGSGQRMDGKSDAGKPAKAVKTAPMRGNKEITGAMDKVAASDRSAFQRALACEVKRNAASRKPAIAVTPEYLTELQARVRKDPKLAAC